MAVWRVTATLACLLTRSLAFEVVGADHQVGFTKAEVEKYLRAVGGFETTGRIVITIDETVPHREGHYVEVNREKGEVVIGGKTAQGVMYGGYTFVNKCLGVVFTITRDIVPKEKKDVWRCVGADHREGPAFKKRGLQPFHDFTSGPDWWDLSDYRAILSQMAKLKMNFIGFHNYPMAEPFVWVGSPSAVGPDGKLTNTSAAYETRWRSTQDNQWGMVQRPTHSYSNGAGALFPRDCYGSPIQSQMCMPTNTTESATLFDSALDFLKEIVKAAHALSIEVAVGTEVPLTKPSGMTSLEAFEGIFKRLNTSGIDYYWHWTPESWEWGQNGVNSSLTQTAVQDLQVSVTAKNNVQAPFQLGTCGWMIGPWDDPTYFDTALPAADIPVLSAIDKHLGWDDTQPAYMNITHHEKWVIPWMEDDPGLIGTELWVNRTLRHANLSREYGIDGFMGIHWRTVTTQLTIKAMADAGWDAGLTVEGVYGEFAEAAFGSSVGSDAAAIMVGVDSFAAGEGPDSIPAGKDCWGNCESALPRPGLTCCAVWEDDDVPDIDGQYKFADDFAALRPKVTDPAQLEVFDEWMHMFQYHKTIAEAQTAAYTFSATVKTITTKAEALSKGVAAMTNASRAYDAMMTELLAFTQTQGELGMIAQNEGMNYMKNIDPVVDKLALAASDGPTESAFMGCWADAEWRAMRYGPGVRDDPTEKYDVKSCGVVCGGYKYFGLQDGWACFCDDDWGQVTRYGAAPNTCSPNGASWVNAVYNHTIQMPLPASAYPATQLPPATRVYLLPSPTAYPPATPYVVRLVTQSPTRPSTPPTLYYRFTPTSQFTATPLAAENGSLRYIHAVTPPGSYLEFYTEAVIAQVTHRAPLDGTVVVNMYA